MGFKSDNLARDFFFAVEQKSRHVKEEGQLTITLVNHHLTLRCWASEISHPQQKKKKKKYALVRACLPWVLLEKHIPDITTFVVSLHQLHES